MTKTANLDLANSYTNAVQRIMERDICTATYGVGTPTIEPERVGQLYFSVTPTEEDRHLRMYVSIASYGEGTRVPVWKEIIANGAHEEDFALRTTANDFHVLDQTIQGRQILTFIDGGDQNPGDRGERPEYDGQFYIATLEMEGGGKDIAVWVASGNTWLPLVARGGGGDVDTTNLAKLDETNIFFRPQMYGFTGDSRRLQLMGASRDFFNPTARYVPFTAGEMHIQEVGDGRVTLWMALVEGDSSSWERIWGESDGIDILTRLDNLETYDDALAEKIATLTAKWNETDVVANQNKGKVAILEFDMDNMSDDMGTVKADIVNHTARIETLEAGGTGGGTPPDYAELQTKVQNNINSIANHETRIVSNDADIATLVSDLQELDLAYDNLIADGIEQDNRILANERNIAINQTNIETNSGDITAHGVDIRSNIARIAALEAHEIGNLSTTVTEHADSLTLVQNSLITMNTQLDTTTTTASQAKLGLTRTDRKVATLEDKATEFTASIADHEGRIATIELGGGGGGDIGDLTPVLERVTAVETEVDTLNVKALPLPDALEANKYLIVNPEGNGYIMSDETVSDVQALAAIAAGVTDGSALINVKSLGVDISTVHVDDINQAEAAVSNIIMASPLFGSSGIDVTMPNIVPFDSTSLGSTEVREGMPIYILNKGAGNLRINASAGHNIFTASQANTTVQLSGEQGMILIPSLYGGKKLFVTAGMFTLNSVALTTEEYNDTEVRGLITALTARVTSVEEVAATLTTSITAVDTKVDAHINVYDLNKVNTDAAISTLTERVNTVDTNAANALGTANNVSGRMGTAEGAIDAVELRAATLETSLTATGGDISDLRDKVTPLEVDMISVKGTVTAHGTRLDALEDIPHAEHPPLPEMGAGNADKFLIWSGDGTSIENSTLTATEATALASFAGATVTGQTCLNLRCMGADTALTGNEVSMEYFCKSPVVILTPSSGNKIVNMGGISPYATAALGATSVREGGIITVANLGAGDATLTPPAGTKIKSGTAETWNEYTLKSGRTVTLYPAIYDSNAKKYIVLSNVSNAWAE